MPIPMQIPHQFIHAVATGDAHRYGCIIKDAGTGRILGHLKEVGTWANAASRVPLTPVTTAGQIIQWLDAHAQFRAIRQTLSQLQLISTVGVVASVTGLGVSIAGFAAVLRRLRHLEANVNAAMERIRVEVERVGLKLEMLATAELFAAWEQLASVYQADTVSRSDKLIKAADQTFQKHRYYYYLLLRNVGPLEQPEVPIAAVRELFGRLLACGQAELEANLLLGDFKHWYFRHERIVNQLAEVCAIQPRKVFQKRVHAAGLLTSAEMEQLRNEVAMIRDFCDESLARIKTVEHEVRWLETQGVAIGEYLASLRQAPDVGVVLIPHTIHTRPR